mmetsp:Transcript_78272/g.130627  ORF Transcript_78272/g.130627 Transcript_78272/m.130627 type:complete len:303 (-) Transcript_78272:1391-2299(-)
MGTSFPTCQCAPLAFDFATSASSASPDRMHAKPAYPCAISSATMLVPRTRWPGKSTCWSTMMMSLRARAARMNASTSSIPLPYVATAASGSSASRTHFRLFCARALSSSERMWSPGGSAWSGGRLTTVDPSRSAAERAVVFTSSSKKTVALSCHSVASMPHALATVRMSRSPRPSDNAGRVSSPGKGAWGSVDDHCVSSAGRAALAALVTRNRTCVGSALRSMSDGKLDEAEGVGGKSIRSFTWGSSGHPCRLALVAALSRMMLHAVTSRSTTTEGHSSATSRPRTKSLANCWIFTAQRLAS